MVFQSFLAAEAFGFVSILVLSAARERAESDYKTKLCLYWREF